ncbi:hypothetical protein PI126_g7164 [Phytophthora idaei]|nr:hypothetical protein PI126_g7164 [Phytophthora idaei]
MKSKKVRPSSPTREVHSDECCVASFTNPTMPKKHDQKMRELGIQIESPLHRELVFEHVEVEGRVVPNHEHHAGPRETPHYHDSQLLVFCVF